VISLGIDCWDGSESQVQNFKLSTNPALKYPLLLKGRATMNAYKITYETSMVIDQKGIIRYLESGVNLSQIQKTIDELILSEIDNKPGSVLTFELQGNYPNPFNPQTVIPFSVDSPQMVRLGIFDMLGREIQTLFSGALPTGDYTRIWDGKNRLGHDMPSGVYFYRLTGDTRTITRRLMLLR
jgi:hypothetical protein